MMGKRYGCLMGAIAFLGGCAAGIDPPEPTERVYIQGTDGDGFRVGSREISPCGRLTVIRERDEGSGSAQEGFTIPADDNAESERLTHSVLVESFCIDVHEVTVEQTTGSVQLRALFPNPDRVLLPGMFVRAKLALAQPSAVLVPQHAAARQPDGNLSVWKLLVYWLRIFNK